VKRCRQSRMPGQPTVHITNKQKKIPIDRAAFRALVRRVLEAEKGPQPGQIGVCFVDDRAIRRLNAQFHHRDEPTDVLSFPLSGTDRTLVADIVVSTETACRQARAYRSSPRRETALYVVHGLLHLLGYDDHSRKDRLRMQRRQRKYL